MPNLFLGFPVSRARFADVAGQAAAAQLPFDDFYYRTHFDSLDGIQQTLAGSGTVTNILTGITLAVTIASGDSVRLRKTPIDPIVPFSWDKKRTLQFRCNVTTVTDNTTRFWFSMGDIQSGRGFGLYLDDGKVYARTKGNSGTTDDQIEDLGAGAYTYRKTLKAVLTPGVDVKFYIDGVLVSTITTNLPSGTTESANILFLYVVNNFGTGSGNAKFSYFDAHQAA